MKNSSISWTDHTFNIVWGCDEVSPACDHCYARALAHRWGIDVWGKNPRKTMSLDYWRQPAKWNAAAERAGKAAWVFCSSMCDIFEVHPTVEGELVKLWPLIREMPFLQWLLLSKRYAQIRKKLPENFRADYPNAHVGVTVESQEYVYRITDQVEWISAEPLLGPIDLLKDHRGRPRQLPESLRWVIVGGESGAGAREMKMEWVRDLQRQCQELGLVFHFKQTGEWLAREIGLRNRHGKDKKEWGRRPLLRNLPQAWPERRERITAA
jgi:protein gp37